MATIKDTGDQEFKAAFSQICDLCGYPKLTDDKFITTVKFIRYHFAMDNMETLLKAYDSLARGTLDEKMGEFKSLTGLAASRVMDAYKRNHKEKGNDDLVEVNGEQVQRWQLNPDARKVLKEKTGKTVFYSDQVTDTEHDLLMDHYILEAQKQYEQERTTTAIIPQMYEYLESSGRLKIFDGKLRKCYGVEEVVICDIDDVEVLAVQIMRTETVKSSNSSMLRGSKVISTSVEDARKKAMVIKYLQS